MVTYRSSGILFPDGYIHRPYSADRYGVTRAISYSNLLQRTRFAGIVSGPDLWLYFPSLVLRGEAGHLRQLRLHLHRLHDMDAIQWLELFYSFSGVKEFRVSSTLGPIIESSLQQAAQYVTFGVFPALRRIHIGRIQLSTSVQFAAAHQLTGP
jgi:hypothetical protein